MSSRDLLERLKKVVAKSPSVPGAGTTADRHARLMQVGREDLSLARLAEAHWDAVAILSEAKRSPHVGAIYGVWASEIPGKALTLEKSLQGWNISGAKMFCSGAGLIDRALMTADAPISRLVEIDLRKHGHLIAFDDSSWKTSAFADTKTATAVFHQVPIEDSSLIGEPGWYLDRAGFWHGACGPAACWAGGAEGLLDYALHHSRRDPHTMAHLGAMSAEMWGMRACLTEAGKEIDAAPLNTHSARVRALTVRHLIEQACANLLRRLSRAYGPQPLAMDAAISRRCQELDLYIRQSHAERDLEELGLLVKKMTQFA